MALIRAGREQDLPLIAAIQAASPEASQWQPSDYLDHELLVAEEAGAMAGFAVFRRIADDEAELLNLAVAPEYRRRGVGRGLLQALLGMFRTSDSLSVFLEVRQSNSMAREFYKRLGFQEIGVRRNYYNKPAEAAVVMKFHSC